MKLIPLMVTACAVALSVPALAGDYSSQPEPGAADTLRYFKGDVTITRKTQTMTISIAPLGNQNGRPAFAIDITNTSPAAINFGLADIAVIVDGKPVVVLTKDELARKAQNAAGWQRFGAAMVAGLTNTNYNTTTTNGYVGRTPVSIQSTTVGRDSYAEQRDRERMDNSIEGALAARLADAANNNVDLTTIDPGASYGGKIVLDKPKAKSWPAEAVVTVRGEAFHFTMKNSK
jgi:hypothetical protein